MRQRETVIAAAGRDRRRTIHGQRIARENRHLHNVLIVPGVNRHLALDEVRDRRVRRGCQNNPGVESDFVLAVPGADGQRAVQLEFRLNGHGVIAAARQNFQLTTRMQVFRILSHCQTIVPCPQINDQPLLEIQHCGATGKSDRVVAVRHRDCRGSLHEYSLIQKDCEFIAVLTHVHLQCFVKCHEAVPRQQKLVGIISREEARLRFRSERSIDVNRHHVGVGPRVDRQCLRDRDRASNRQFQQIRTFARRDADDVRKVQRGAFQNVDFNTVVLVPGVDRQVLRCQRAQSAEHINLQVIVSAFEVDGDAERRRRHGQIHGFLRIKNFPSKTDLCAIQSSNRDRARFRHIDNHAIGLVVPRDGDGVARECDENRSREQGPRFQLLDLSNPSLPKLAAVMTNTAKIAQHCRSPS